jgi:hypothetical protein|tara:strand:- start:65 stop:217 length:153 start_codon:yes stop_codon:yes gene_type:complete
MSQGSYTGTGDHTSNLMKQMQAANAKRTPQSQRAKLVTNNTGASKKNNNK